MKLACAVLVLLTLSSLGGCDRFKKKTDAGSTSTNTTTTTTTDDDTGVASADDAAVEAAAVAVNEKAVKRFPDEEALIEAVTLQWPTVVARTEPSSGAIVATLAKGAAANMIARKGKTVLATFQDPKDATKTLMGWIAEDAFTPGTSPPPVVVHTDGGPPKATGVCPAGLTLLFDADAFCGKTCKVDKDCAAPQVCKGTAKPLTPSGLGAPVAVCAKSKPDAGAPKPIPTVVVPAADAGHPAVPGADAGTTILSPVGTSRAGTIK